MWILTALFKPLAYVSVPYILLKYATENNPVARFYFRVVVYYSALGLCSVWGMVVAVGMSLVGQRFDINWVVARSFYTLAGKLLDIKFVVEGEEHLDTKPAILVGNHQSGLDILFLGRYVQPSPPSEHVKLICCPYSFPLTYCVVGRAESPCYAGYSPSMRLSWPRRSLCGLRYWEDTLWHRVRFSWTGETMPQPYNH